MNPRLFDKNANDFTTLGIGVLSDVISCNVVESLNGKYELNMTLLTSDKYYSLLDIGSIIVANPNAIDNQQAFVVESIEKNIDGVVEVYAVHIAQHRAKLIPVMQYTANSLANAISQIMANSQETNPFTLTTNKTSSATVKQDVPKSFRECLGGSRNSLLDVYGGEYKYNNFEISLLKRRGKETDVSILYGLNMTELNVEDEFSFENSITGILPYWFSEEEGIVVGSVQYSSNADIFPYKKSIAYDFTSDFENKPTVAQLNTYAQSFVVNRGITERNLKCSFEQIQQLNTGDNLKRIETLQLGDTVTVRFDDYGINYESRIIETDYDVLLERYNSMTIGDKKTTINDAISSIAETIVDDFNVVASDVKYNDTLSQLGAENVQGAIEYLDSKIDKIGFTYSKGFTNFTLPNASYKSATVLENIPKGTYLVITLFQFGTGANGVRRTITYANSETMPSFTRYNGATMQPLSNGVSMLQYTRVLTLGEDNNSIGLGGYQSNGSEMTNCNGMIYATRIA